MQLILAHIGPRNPGGDEFNALTALYLQRASAFAPTESMAFRSERNLLEWLDRKAGRTLPVPWAGVRVRPEQPARVTVPRAPV